MSSQIRNLDDNHEEGSPPSTPLASSQTVIVASSASPSICTQDSTQRPTSPFQPSLSSSSDSNNASQFLLPIPTPSVNKSQSSFAYSDSLNSDSEGPSLGVLPPEIASADISIAPDGSFVETSSGPAARELKRRYDQHLGVGVDKRSPYAITAFVNQHGKQMFRVGNRQMSPPAASSVTDEARLSLPKISDDSAHLQAPTKTKRRSRMSVHTLIPPSLKKPPPDSIGFHANAPRNKLRKTRSIPDMFNTSFYASASSVNVPGTQTAGPGPFTTGRAHSHSVTGADLPRLPPVAVAAPAPTGDLFGHVMCWNNIGTPTTSVSSGSGGSALFARAHMSPGQGSSSSSQRDYFYVPAVFPQPFGPDVDFESPARKSGADADYLPMPHMLREVQSFESGLTARAGDPDLQSPKGTGSPLAGPLPELNIEDNSTESTPHASFMPVSKNLVPDVEPDVELLDLGDSSGSPAQLTPLEETSMHSRYSTDVFDVLQTYRGLPLLDRMDDHTVIKMSYRPDDTASPRDDPRFVLWGEQTAHLEQDDPSTSQGSLTGLSSPAHSHASRRRSAKIGKTASVSQDPPTFRVSQDDSTSRVLVAATIERRIAQLTSDLNYDELLNFFLTYRTYISAVDLCHLLICRFHWSLGKNSSSHDEMVRRIVRVRTFVAIRYWLLTFFNDDFLPNRELRLSLANWLNALIRDPILKSHTDGLSIVRKLIKVVKDCKDAHIRRGRSSTKKSMDKPSTIRSTTSHVLGDKFAEATYREEDSDVDLDFLPDEGAVSNNTGGFPRESVNAHLSAVHDGTGLSAIPKPTPVPSASAAILQQPLPLNILPQSRVTASSAGRDLSFLQSPTTLPVHHNSLSRVFIKTIGRLGHWKRVLNSRQSVQAPLGSSTDVSAFDLELTAEGDLLAVRGGVEQYLKMIEQQSPTPPPVRVSAPTPPPELKESRVSHAETVSEARSSTVVGDDDPSPDYADGGSMQPTETESSNWGSQSADITPQSQQSYASPVKTFKKSRPRSSSSSSSDSSLGSPIRSRSRPASTAEPAVERSHWGFDVVSIDDLDLSDTSSDFHEALPAPPGLKKLTRKLPLRREFEFVRRSRESVSSMGITSHRSVLSENSVASGGEPELGGGGLFQQWQLNAIVDSLSDNEESGDVDATLRRLEGQINPQKQQEKVSKVDSWVKTIQERIAAGDYTNETPRFLDDEEGAEDGEPDLDDDNRSAHWTGFNDSEDITGPIQSVSQGSSSRTSQESIVLSASNLVGGPSNQGASGPVSPRRSPETKPVAEDAVPLEILQSRVPSRPSTSHGAPVAQSASTSTTLNNFVTAVPKLIPTKSYRSWILNYKAQSLVEHFSVIDRELFMGVKFEELVRDDWISCQEVNVLDWAQFLKDRARWKAESRLTHKTSALAAVRARFNLLANFTLSEVVLTHPHERPLIVKKLIRVAWKAYCLSNYNALVAIMTGLQSDWVAKAIRSSWPRIGNWEKRVYEDLLTWINAKDDFKFVRKAVTDMVDAKPINVGSHAASIISTGATDGQSSKSKTTDTTSTTPSACVPFIGIYLSQLYRLSKLPDLIDPTAPEEVVGIDPVTGNFDAPAHPEVFSDLAPLPQSLQLEPLINVHKQRLIADVIKMLVAGQHLASRVEFSVDKKIFQKCLRLRGLSPEMIQQAQTMYG